MNIGFVMTLQVNQLFFFYNKVEVSMLFLQNIKINKEENGAEETGQKKQKKKKKKCGKWKIKTYLSPSKIRSNKKLDISMFKNPQDHSPQIPLSKVAPSLEQFRSSFFLSLFISCPRVTSVSACFDVFGVMMWLPAFVREESWEYENGFNPQLFEST